LSSRVSGNPSEAVQPGDGAAGAARAPGATPAVGSSAAAPSAPSLGGRDGVFTPTGLAIGGALLACFAVMFGDFFYRQHLFSWGSEDWMHAYFIPVISLYLIWEMRRELARVPVETFWPGLIPLVTGIVCYVFFLVGFPNHMGKGWSVILAIFGLVLLMCGPRMARATILPIGYLAMGVTISEAVMIQLTAPLQVIASVGGNIALQAVGLTTDRSGTVLNVLTSSGKWEALNVAEQCSGMRSVIGFMALGLAVALVGVRHWWQRSVLILLAVPIAIFMNVIRVAVLGLGAIYNPEVSRGTSHMLIGTILLMGAFVIYMALVWALNRAVVEDAPAGEPSKGAPTKGAPAKAAPAKAAPGASSKGGAKGALGVKVRGAGMIAGGAVNWGALARPSVVAGCAVLLVSGAAVLASIQTFGLHLAKEAVYAEGGRKVRAIPTETASWERVGQDEVGSKEIVEALGTENYLTRIYRRKNAPEGKQQYVHLHLAYYTGMIDTVPHVPERCMVGGGAQLVSGPWVVPLWTAEDRAKLERSWKPVTEFASGLPESVAKAWAPVVRESKWMALEDDKAVQHRVLLPRNVFDINLMVSEFNNQIRPGQSTRDFMGYFFIANGGHVASANDVRRLAFQLDDRSAYYLKFQVGSSGVGSAQELAEAASSLLGELMPEIMRTVPDWESVTIRDAQRGGSGGGGGVGGATVSSTK
jgi:exosortase